LALCGTCGTLQKPADAFWCEEIARIYGAYTLYHQTGGDEQCIFTEDGQRIRRSEFALRHLLDRWHPPETGRMLDVGAGKGAALRAFAEFHSAWELHALDIDEHDLGTLSSIPGFAALYTCAVTDIRRTFHLITAIHSLEHLVDPRAMLQGLRDRLEPGGRLVIQVPYWRRNPFDLVIADHRTHFTAGSMFHLLDQTGFSVDFLSTELLTKEVSAIATHDGLGRAGRPESDSLVEIRRSAVAALQWLETVIDGAENAARSEQPLGILGTAIAAAWLAGRLADKIAFFVEENPSLVGGTFMGRAVYAPDTVPPGSVVFLPLPATAAHAVAARFANLPFQVAGPKADPR
jgi:SAM-dependent methyltransferase